MLIRELVFHSHLEERHTEYITIYQSPFKPLTKINLQQQNDYQIISASTTGYTINYNSGD